MTDQQSTFRAATGRRRRGGSPWRNPWVIGWVALVGVVLLANTAMVTFSVVSNPGLVVEDYYEKGQRYAETRLAQRLAEPSGWEVRLDLPERIAVAVPVSIRVAAADERGLPVRADRAKLFAYRPADASVDFEAVLEPIAPGVTGSEVVFPRPGAWDLIVQVSAGDRVYDLARRISVLRE